MVGASLKVTFGQSNIHFSVFHAPPVQVGVPNAVGQVEKPASNHLHGTAQVVEVFPLLQAAKSG